MCQDGQFVFRVVSKESYPQLILKHLAILKYPIFFFQEVQLVYCGKIQQLTIYDSYLILMDNAQFSRVATIHERECRHVS